MASWTLGRLSPCFIFLVSRKLSQRVASTLNCPKKCALLFHFTFIYQCLYFFRKRDGTVSELEQLKRNCKKKARTPRAETQETYALWPNLLGKTSKTCTDKKSKDQFAIRMEHFLGINFSNRKRRESIDIEHNVSLG